MIGATLGALARQGRNLTIRVVDDESGDGTAAVARAAGPGVEVLAGTAPPVGWMGKLWALERGRRGVATPLILLLDADIELAPGLLAALVERKRSTGAGLVSVLAALRMETFWERLLMPAYVFFFKLVYPFHVANSASRLVAAAAGGCILIETRILAEIGGFVALRGALIDDCALARTVKNRGYRTWIGLSRGVISRRAYPDLRSVWDLVARSAFTQLRYSTLLLVGCSGLLIAAFWLPVAGLWFANPLGRGFALAALAAMLACYIPTLRYYDRSPAWALALPVVGTLYLAMTWSSALRYWAGVRARWRDRTYGANEAIGGEHS